MDNNRKRKFHLFIIQEEKEYVCADCGSYTMKASKLDFLNDYEAKAKVKCIHCNHERDTTFTYFED